MRKGLLCAFACMSLMLVACSGKKAADSSENKDYADYVTLGSYKGMELTEKTVKVTDQDLQDKINEILSQNSTAKEIKKGKVKEGDTVNIDFKGTKDGVAFDGGTATGQSLTIGSNTYIEGFEDGLIGVKVGDTVDLNLTFPENYGNEDLNGQDVVFEVKVNYIEGKKVTPKWNDNFVQGISDYNTTKDYEQELKEELNKDAEESVKYDLEYQILDNLVNDSKYESLPEKDVNSYTDSMKKYYKDYAEKNNMEYKDLLSNTFQMSEDEFNAQVQSTAENAIKQKVAVYAVAEKEKLKPEGDELEKKELSIAQQYGYDKLEDFATAYGDDYAEQLVIRQVVIDYIKENAKITKDKKSTDVEDAEAAATQEKESDGDSSVK